MNLCTHYVVTIYSTLTIILLSSCAKDYSVSFTTNNVSAEKLYDITYDFGTIYYKHSMIVPGGFKTHVYFRQKKDLMDTLKLSWSNASGKEFYREISFTDEYYNKKETSFNVYFDFTQESLLFYNRDSTIGQEEAKKSAKIMDKFYIEYKKKKENTLNRLE